MWRAAACLIAACIAAAVSAAPASAAVQFRFPGRGWGHGIGMSQYGAQGFAERGYSARQIIEYYYADTSVQKLGGNPTYKVLLRVGGTSLNFDVEGSGVTVERGGVEANAFQEDDRIRIDASASKTCIFRTRGDATVRIMGGCRTGTVTMSGPVRGRFTADSGAWGNRYRGHLEVTSDGVLRVINHVRLEDYLRGVVPSEMPTSWHAAALGAQAIAARSYALATRKSGDFDAYADTRSQVYRGIEEEEPESDAAIRATVGQTAVHDGNVIPAFFHSTSGGRTAAIEDVWNSEPRPYLTSRRDPWERSPYSRWSTEDVTFTPAQLKRMLGSDLVAGGVRSIRVTTNASRRARTVVITGSRGINTASASTVQARLGLRSTWFRVEKLSMTRTPGETAIGQRIRLTGEAPRTRATHLVFRASGGDSWVRVTTLRVRDNGTWVSRPRVRRAGWYRLQRAGALGPGVRIRVG